MNADIEHKTQLKQQEEQQLQQDMQRFKDMEREAAALISKARHANSKLMVSTRQPQCTAWGWVGTDIQLLAMLSTCILRCVTHTNTQAKTAQAALQEARGFTATIPTTELIKSKQGAAAGSNSSGR